MITQSPTLKYFNHKLIIKVSSDASTQELGVLLEQLHDEKLHPIAYDSRPLTLAEINYCRLELEILSILFACVYFQYVDGQHFIVHNDYKPLKRNEQITKDPPTIQSLLLKLKI